ncbi:MAG: RPA family protein [Thermoplasmatota archaeon]
MSMIKREVAWRIFASEFNQSTLECGGEEERSPSYIVTPLGAMVNRLYVVGVLTETENMGTPEEPMYRARVTDPTGTYFISAGQYQPQVATALAEMEPPSFVAVVGKANMYSPDEETKLVSIRGEHITEVNEEQRDYWILEASKSLKERLEAAVEASKMEDVSVEELMDLGYDTKLAEGLKKAADHYQKFPTDRYWTYLEDSLRYVLPEYESPTAEEIKETSSEEEVDEEVEESILDILEEMEDSDGGNGVEYEKVMDKVVDEEDITQDEFEEAINSLRTTGKIYEPVLGNIKRIY